MVGLTRLAVSLTICLPIVVHGATLQVSDGQLLGAQDVLVGDELWDVVFYDGPWDFSAGTDLPATNRTDADAFSQALFDQVLLDSELGSFDSDPETTSGCANTNSCSIFTPYLVDETSTSFSMAVNQRVEGIQEDFISQTELGLIGDFSDVTTRVLALWSPVADNVAPTADAGGDQAVRAGDTVFLDGGASFDDNTPTESLQFVWEFVLVPGGSTAVLSGANTANADFVADVAGTYVVQLTVTDEDGLTSEPDSTTVGSDNLAPTANAGVDQLVVVGSSVFLDGTASTDPEDDALAYSWLISSSPLGSSAGLTGGDTAFPNFVPDVEGIYTVTLSVSDPIGPGTSDDVSVTATTPDWFTELAILDASAIVASLDGAEVTTAGNQNALNNFLIQAIVAVQEDDLTEARRKLEQALSRTDGCTFRGVPDGNGPERDWITACSAQALVFDLLQSALVSLEL